jgi:ABC-2 type transport system ATP-binding protein
MIIETEGLLKQYRDLVAVANLHLNVFEGDIYGFIGPNGAGKTSTIKILATLLQPTSGKAKICGYDVVKQPQKVRRVIGYMPDFFGVYDDMKVWEYLDFFAAAYNIQRSRRKIIIEDVLELTNLIHKKDEFVESLSRGMKQSLCLAKTLVHDPEVLLLDEPASGLDPRARVELRELLKELKNMGKTILISSHILSELADFCNKIGIIEHGRLVAQGSVDQIMSKVQENKIFLIGLRDRHEEAAGLLSGLPNIARVEPEADGVLKVFIEGHYKDAADLIGYLISQGLAVTSCTEYKAGLEDIFMTVTEGIVG